MEKVVKKSGLNAKERFDFEKLAYPREGLVPCTYKESLEELAFEYQTEGLRKVKQLKEELKENQYQFLINFAKLRELISDYKLDFSETNVFYDENFMPYILDRDIFPRGTGAKMEDFLFEYKTFIGGILGKRYSITQLQESGLEILKKEKTFEAFYKEEAVEGLVELLRERKEGFLKKQKQSTVRISKGRNRVQAVVAILSTLLLFAAGALLIHHYVNVLPRNEIIITANEAYIAKDYIRCIDSLRAMSPEEMDTNTKYILAVSYARGESLKKEEIDGIISKLSLMSNEKELDYWIHLGRLEMENAVDLAQALSEDQLLMYAYMKELNYLESNTNIAGEDKASRISELEGAIKTLGDKYSEDK